LVEHDEVDAAGLALLGDLNQVLERAAEPVELGDDELVTVPVGGGEGLVALGTPRELAGSLVDEELIAESTPRARRAARRGWRRARVKTVWQRPAFVGFRHEHTAA
jgi:hypothetical protein